MKIFQNFIVILFFQNPIEGFSIFSKIKLYNQSILNFFTQLKNLLLRAVFISTSFFISAYCKAQNAYWQQKVDTKIEVLLDDKNHELMGHIQMNYFNESPDTLRYIYIHLYPNAYSSDRTAFCEQQILNKKTAFYYSKIRGRIDSLDFEINEKKVKFYNTIAYPEIARIDLPEPLLPHQQMKISTPFKVFIPLALSRLGHNGQAYYISQWFPKPAVYDQNGWHPLPYYDQGEFYSEYGAYEVAITLPQNYVLLATGNCMDESEQLFLKQKSLAPLPNDTLYKRSFPKSDLTFKTVHFSENNIHDFAWFADKRYSVRTDTFSIMGNDQPIVAYAAFLPKDNKIWAEAIANLKQSTQYYSNQVGSYPYHTVKAVSGILKAGGGMEYPTITLIDAQINNKTMLKDVLTHEVGHNWFYGILGSNERSHAWMDEGINSFYEHKNTELSTYPKKVASQHFLDKMEEISYYMPTSEHKGQAIENEATQFTEMNYGGMVYMKTALCLSWLENYIGSDSFKNAMSEYFLNWKFKHPQPNDFKKILQKHTTKNIDWFFEGVLKDENAIDFSIKKIRKTEISLINRSHFAAPVGIHLIDNQAKETLYWTNPFKGKYTFNLPEGRYVKGFIDPSIPDINIKNNSYKSVGLFHRYFPKIGFGAGLLRSKENKIFVLPAIGYNVYDGFMAGLVFHNISLINTHFKYAISPLYSFSNNRLTGLGTVSYSIYPKKLFQEICFQLDGKSFHYDKLSKYTDKPMYERYMKLAPSIALYLKPKDAHSTISNLFLLKSYFINEEAFTYSRDTNNKINVGITSTNQSYGLLRFVHENQQTFNPYKYTAEVQIGQYFTKLSLSANARIDYYTPKKSLYLRAFAGKLIKHTNSNPYAADRYVLNATYTAMNDYLYDDQFIGRNEQMGTPAQQLNTEKEGGMKMPTPYYANTLGIADNWLIGVNIKTDLPIDLPVKLYLDFSTYNEAKQNNPSGNRFIYQAGLELSLFKNYLKIQIPLINCKDYKEYLTSIYNKKAFQHSIMFSVNFQSFYCLQNFKKLIL